jgi:hypothetical protein
MRLLTARVMEAVKSAMLVDVVEDLRELVLGGRELEVAKFIEARPHVVSVQVAGDGVLRAPARVGPRFSAPSGPPVTAPAGPRGR